MRENEKTWKILAEDGGKRSGEDQGRFWRMWMLTCILMIKSFLKVRNVDWQGEEDSNHLHVFAFCRYFATK